MKRFSLLAVMAILLTAGCGGAAQQATPTARPVSLPPTHPPEAATPCPTPLPPTAAPSSTPSPTPTASPTTAPSPTPAATPTETVIPLTPIGMLAGMVGQEVTVGGTVIATASFSSGFKFTLDDGTGQVVLLMWHNVYDDCWDRAGLNVGARVRVTGTVGQYEGELQIEPSWGGGVQVLEPAGPQAPILHIGELSPAHEGQRVMVEGEIVRVSGFESAVQVVLGDGTNEIVLFIWRNVLDRIPNNTALGTPGSRVRAVGTVTIYRGTLEIQPTLPYDVVVE
jgi:DNA/RNA endonuclease YhcR with UshA esterase domain